VIRAGGRSFAEMLWVRYFLFVGGVLLVLLFVSDAYLPKMPMPRSAAADLSTIRISSDRKWPERMVFDTSTPVVAAVQLAQADAPVAAQAAVAEVAAKSRLRQAFAQMTSAQTTSTQMTSPEPKLIASLDLRPPPAKPQRRHKVARRHVGPPTVLVAQQPQFGFFASSTW
jgi:hypothetical protein